MPKIKVLPVDDNPAILKRIVEGLAQKPDIVIPDCALDGVSALRMIDEYDPDVLLLDIVMPRLDGFAVLEALSRREKMPKVIMATSLAGDAFIERSIRLGASYYMIKPLDPEILHQRILETVAAETDYLPTPKLVPEPMPRHSIEEQITNLFLTIGIPAHIKGYQFLREAVNMVIEKQDVINRITKELYPGIARKFGTTSSKVERAMRHAIEVAWNRGRLDSINKMYGYNVFSPDDKPTNGEFIALVSDKVRMAKSA